MGKPAVKETEGTVLNPHKGGSLRLETSDIKKVEPTGIDHYTVTPTTNGRAKIVIYTIDSTSRQSFKAGNKVVLNTKATRNSNSDNNLVVLNRDGPEKYTCEGPAVLKK